MPATKKRTGKKKRPPKKGEQLVLARTGGIGGKRKGAGRKPAAGKRRNVPHRKRPPLDGKNHPVHVTMRVKRGVGIPSLRSEVVRARVRDVLRETMGGVFHTPHFSLQDDHLHLLVEAANVKALASGMSGLVIRIAKRLNAMLRRKGAVWDGRYHRHDLVTPTEVAHCIVYVLQNGKKQPGTPRSPRLRNANWLDEYSSARECPHPDHRGDGWADVAIEVGRIERPPRTWLLRIGWRRSGVQIATTSAPKLLAA